MARLKKALKSFLGYVAYKARFNRFLLGDRAVIVAFHRVSDAAVGSRINCPPGVFIALCRFFANHFDVISLAELLRRLRQRESVKGALVITFDDGYKDNFEFAAPILSRLKLPATFFVATNFLGSDTVPFWDANDGVPSEWMTWDDVESLKNLGFDIGGHTMNHIDLAAVDLEVARREIEGCRQILTQKLDVSVEHFAYPFGGVGNISPATRELVASSGFSCCLSCHGGIVASGDEDFSLPREPINAWVTSPYQYGLELILKSLEKRQ